MSRDLGSTGEGLFYYGTAFLVSLLLAVATFAHLQTASDSGTRLLRLGALSGHATLALFFGAGVLNIVGDMTRRRRRRDDRRPFSARSS